MKFEITNTEVKQRTVKSKKDGKEYTFYTQEAWFHDENSPYPVSCVVPVDNAASAYHFGWYNLASGSHYVDRFGNLTIARRFTLEKIPVL